MNILPEEQKNSLYKGFKTRFFIVLSIMISFGFLASSIMLVPGYLASSVELEEVVSQTQYAKKEINQEVKDIINLPRDINTKVRFLGSNSVNKTTFSIIDMAVSKDSSGISINSISSITVKDGERTRIDGIILSGVAKDRKSLLEFSKSLEEEKSFSKVDVPVNSLTKDVNLPFSINITIAR